MQTGLPLIPRLSQVENKKLQKQVDNLKEKLELSQQTSQDNITLSVENQRLSKALSTSQKAVSRVAELESELEDKVCVASGVVDQNYLH